ncbi:transposase [Buttiauxella gaviniae ATCC 51604]|uniref:Transposase n=1 Tax=Buttiauxella gaviniae ATCC 51604 TaxID=1354253 RepID=A0A1B7HK96_9ENTR|nr:transposase [Buttiauxella gaviniae ATCC 51604]
MCSRDALERKELLHQIVNRLDIMLPSAVIPVRQRLGSEAAFQRQTYASQPGLYPQVKMVCQMELTSHLLTVAAFGTMKESEYTLAEQLINQTGDNL